MRNEEIRTRIEARAIASYELARAEDIIKQTVKSMEFMTKRHNEFKSTFDDTTLSYGSETTHESKIREIISYAGFQADLFSAAYHVYKDMCQLLSDFVFSDYGFTDEDEETQDRIKTNLLAALDLCYKLSRKPENVAQSLGIDLADKPQTMITSY